MLYNRSQALPVAPNAASIGIIAGVTLTAGILAACIPARQASRLDVVDALRDE